MVRVSEFNYRPFSHVPEEPVVARGQSSPAHNIDSAVDRCNPASRLFIATAQSDIRSTLLSGYSTELQTAPMELTSEERSMSPPDSICWPRLVVGPRLG